MQKLISLALAIVMFGGCAHLESDQFKPVVEDKVGSKNVDSNDKRVGTLATVAQRRLALIRFEDGRFCAEPPPDATDNISSSLSAAVSGGTQNITAGAQLASAFATLAKQLFYRSQGIQLYRDGMFALCNAYLNKAVDEPTFRQKHDELLKVARELILAEIPHLANIKSDTSGSPTPPAPPILPSIQPPPPSPQPAPDDRPAGGTIPGR